MFARRSNELAVERALAANHSPIAAPLVWTGTARQFGDYIVKLYADGLIEASSQREAIFKAAGHYVLKNGKALNPAAIYNSLAARQNLEGKPSDIRIGKSPNKR